MNSLSKSSFPSKTTEPPLALGVPADKLGADAEMADGLMTEVIFKLRVNQLVTTLRGTQQITGEAATMLGVLESLVIAGEIPFVDFMQRVQNLFPDVFDKVDASLRENLLRMLVD